jgi:hypothetical protein
MATVDGMIMAVEFLLEHASVGGYCTPSHGSGPWTHRIQGCGAIDPRAPE